MDTLRSKLGVCFKIAPCMQVLQLRCTSVMHPAINSFHTTYLAAPSVDNKQPAQGSCSLVSTQM